MILKFFLRTFKMYGPNLQNNRKCRGLKKFNNRLTVNRYELIESS